MIIEVTFIIPAKFTTQRMEGKIVNRTITPDIDYEVDPVISMNHAEYETIEGKFMSKARILIDNADLDYFKKKWELVE